jgi:hypothetical protein
MTTRAEQETIIQWDEDEQLVRICSSSRKVWRRLEREGFAIREELHDARSWKVTGRVYEPIAAADFRWGKKRKRSAAQLAAARKGAFTVRDDAKAARTPTEPGLVPGSGQVKAGNSPNTLAQQISGQRGGRPSGPRSGGPSPGRRR